MKQVIGAQGEVTIIKIDALPADISAAKIERTEKGWIISHSERGHHHICAGGTVMEANTAPAGMRILYAILEEPAAFIQDAPTPHEPYSLPAGLYEFRIAREFDPFSEQARQVKD